MTHQASLFGTPEGREPIDAPDAELWLDRSFIPASEAPVWMDRLRTELPWRQEQIKMYGKVHPVPRLSCWLGQDGLTYRYSGILHHPEPWGPVAPVLERVEAATGVRFNSALANCYRSGADSVGWHADDERELGPRPYIASVSLGGTRRFLMRHRRTRQKIEIELTSGSLLWMGGETQLHWEHSIPRTKRPVQPRVNLTFRWVFDR